MEFVYLEWLAIVLVGIIILGIFFASVAWSIIKFIWRIASFICRKKK